MAFSAAAAGRTSIATDASTIIACGLEHVLLIWNRLRCVRARRSARRDAKSDAVTSVERRNNAGARPRTTLRAGGFCVAGSSTGSLVVPATLFALLLPAPQNPLGVGVSI